MSRQRLRAARLGAYIEFSPSSWSGRDPFWPLGAPELELHNGQELELRESWSGEERHESGPLKAGLAA